MTKKCRLIVFGSLAYDDIYSYRGAIRDHLPVENTTPLYVNIRASGPKTRRGGCGGNIAWTAAQLSIPVSLVSWVGGDGGEYVEFLDKHGISTDTIDVLQGEPTLRGILLSDIHQDQFLIFSAQRPLRYTKPVFKDDHGFAVITAGIPQHTKKIVLTLKQKKIPYSIDPGKFIQDISREDLLFCINGADSLVVNRYEQGLLQKRTGRSWKSITKLVGSAVVTRGETGSSVHTSKGESTIPAVKPLQLCDPYGAGDAFLAGFSVGRMIGYSPEWSARIGAVAASFVLEKEGTQENPFTVQDFSDRLHLAFGRPDISLINALGVK